MDESTLLARTGKKLRKSLKAFRIHLKRVKTRPQTKSRINDRSSTLADLKNLQRLLTSHNSRIRALNKHNLHFQERSLRRMLAGQLRLHPTIGAETSTWRFKRAMSEVEQELRREAVALQGIERALLTALKHLLYSSKSLRSVERKAEFQLSGRLVAMAEKLQQAVDCGARDRDWEDKARELLGSIELQVREARVGIASIRFAALGLACDASQLGVKVARQTLLEEYFSGSMGG
ncbi:hypothetical protein NU195Hw_g7538t1 [Hortaea werneckii]